MGTGRCVGNPRKEIGQILSRARPILSFIVEKYVCELRTWYDISVARAAADYNCMA